MAAEEEQAQRVVAVRRRSSAGARRRSIVILRLHRRELLPAAPRFLAAHLVGHPASGDLDQPAPRVIGYAGLGPLPRGRQKRFLHRVLGGVEIPMTSQHRAENPRRELAQQALDGGLRGRCRHISSGGALLTWRTSIGTLLGAPPRPGAAEARAA